MYQVGVSQTVEGSAKLIHLLTQNSNLKNRLTTDIFTSWLFPYLFSPISRLNYFSGSWTYLIAVINSWALYNEITFCCTLLNLSLKILYARCFELLQGAFELILKQINMWLNIIRNNCYFYREQSINAKLSKRNRGSTIKVNIKKVPLNIRIGEIVRRVGGALFLFFFLRTPTILLHWRGPEDGRYIRSLLSVKFALLYKSITIYKIIIYEE